MKAAIFWFGVIIVQTFSSLVISAPLTFNTALPVSKGETILRVQYLITKSKDDSSKLDRNTKAWSVVSTVAYGLSPKLAVFATIPYTHRQMETFDANRSTTGIADSQFIGRYTLYHRDFQGGTARIAPLLGLKIPTGSDNERDKQGRLPRGLQLGTGSWDSFGGVVVTYASVNWEVDAQFSYRENRQANGFELGDISRFDASLQYRLSPQNLDENTSHFFNGVLEVNWINQNRNTYNGLKDRGSGGVIVYLVPGAQYITQRWIVEAGIQIPVRQQLNDSALKKDYIVRTSIRANF